MKRLLYIGHIFHKKKTHSHEFLLEILRRDFDVMEKYVDPEYIDYKVFDDIKGLSFDVCCYFQVFLNTKRLQQIVDFKRLVFFPMYDGLPRCTEVIDTAWSYTNFLVISFCKATYEFYSKLGICCKYIQYFPAPTSIFIPGDDKSIFFWQRRSGFDLEVLSEICKHISVEKIHHHKAMDYQEPCKAIEECSMKERDFFRDVKIKESIWYENRDLMHKDVLKSAIYIAPRLKEGIGMSFLEAMASGRCVIAPNFPTMNEYITHGKTGLLYDCAPRYAKMSATSIDEPGINIQEIQKEAYEYIKTGYNIWRSERWKINDWIKDKSPSKWRFTLMKSFIRTNIFYKIKGKHGSTYYSFGMRLFHHKKCRK